MLHNEQGVLLKMWNCKLNKHSVYTEANIRTKFDKYYNSYVRLEENNNWVHKSYVIRRAHI
jgi:hypothetical protein